MKMYLMDYNTMQRNEQIVFIKTLSWIYYEINQRVFNGRYHCFVRNYKKLSSNMAHISEHCNSSNHKIHSYDQMSKIIVNLGSNKCKKNNISYCQLNRLQNSLSMSIVETPEKIYPMLIGNMK